MAESKNNTNTTTPAWDNADETSLGELLTILWGGRYLVLGSTLLVTLGVWFYVWCVTPIYESSALLQIEGKRANVNNQALGTMAQSLYETNSPEVKGELEILRSNLVIGQVVEKLHLDITVTPKLLPVIGPALVRDDINAPVLDVEDFTVPTSMQGLDFVVKASDNSGYILEAPDGLQIAKGTIGDVVNATWRRQPITLKVRNMIGSADQKFVLQKQPLLLVMEKIRGSLIVTEQTKESSILCLSLRHPKATIAADILNNILAIYLRQHLNRKTEETTKNLAFMQDQLLQIKGKLDADEARLNRFRAGSNSTDLSAEARVILDKSSNLESQILALRQRKQELLRTYRGGSDKETTIDRQISELENEVSRTTSRSRRLPQNEQEVMKLTREVQVDQTLYTSLKNSVQQLQMAKAGEVGNARIVDNAMPSLSPVKPQKTLFLGIGGVMGALSGLGLIMLRRALHKGIENPQLLEAKLGLPVLAAVPHSHHQKSLYRKIQKGEQGRNLLAVTHPKDLAIESLLSLRTNLHFTMLDVKNKAIMITGPSPDIGKSFVSVNLAAVMAQSGEKVLLVDADMRKGRLSRYFGFKERASGLSEVLSGQRDWKTVVQHDQIGLDFVSTGIMPPNPADLLLGGRFDRFLDEVCAYYDVVLIDAPPVLAVTDATVIGVRVGGVLMLVNAGHNSLEEIRTALRRLDAVGIRPRGFIFNDVNNITTRYSYNYHYGYAGRE